MAQSSLLVSRNVRVSKSGAALPALPHMESGWLIADMPNPGMSAPPACRDHTVLDRFMNEGSNLLPEASEVFIISPQWHVVPSAIFCTQSNQNMHICAEL